MAVFQPLLASPGRYLGHDCGQRGQCGGHRLGADLLGHGEIARGQILGLREAAEYGQLRRRQVASVVRLLGASTDAADRDA